MCSAWCNCNRMPRSLFFYSGTGSPSPFLLTIKNMSREQQACRSQAPFTNIATGYLLPCAKKFKSFYKLFENKTQIKLPESRDIASLLLSSPVQASHRRNTSRFYRLIYERDKAYVNTPLHSLCRLTMWGKGGKCLPQGGVAEGVLRSNRSDDQNKRNPPIGHGKRLRG